jgi:hypothetical protein
MFCDLHPQMKISYESRRTIFNTKFNTAFGSPRTDTCSSCDEILVKIKSLQSDISRSNSIDEKERLQNDIKQLTIQNNNRSDLFIFWQKP